VATQRQQPSLETQGQAVGRLTEQLRDKDEALLRLQVQVQSLQVNSVHSLMKVVLMSPTHCACCRYLQTCGHFV
jgi:hypothetical protein